MRDIRWDKSALVLHSHEWYLRMNDGLPVTNSVQGLKSERTPWSGGGGCRIDSQCMIQFMRT